MDLIDLVIAARAGDRAAFGTIVRRFLDMAFGGAYARLGDVDESQDAAPEAFLDAWRLLGDLRDPAAFPGWFRRIVLKHADRIARARQRVLPAIVLDGIPASAPDPAAALEAVELRDSVRAAVAKLPDTRRDLNQLLQREAGHRVKHRSLSLADPQIMSDCRSANTHSAAQVMVGDRNTALFAVGPPIDYNAPPMAQR